RSRGPRREPRTVHVGRGRLQGDRAGARPRVCRARRVARPGDGRRGAASRDVSRGQAFPPQARAQGLLRAEMTGGVLWDLDGTLVDSEDYHWRSWRDTMRGDGVVISHDQFLASFGLRNDRILTAWLGDVAADRIQRLGDAKEAEYRRLAQTHRRRRGSKRRAAPGCPASASAAP